MPTDFILQIRIGHSTEVNWPVKFTQSLERGQRQVPHPDPHHQVLLFPLSSVLQKTKQKNTRVCSESILEMTWSVLRLPGIVQGGTPGDNPFLWSDECSVAVPLLGNCYILTLNKTC